MNAPAQTVDNRVRQVVSNIRNLPTPPIVFSQIQKVLNDPNVSAAQVASILSEDPAMSVKVLKLTNSAFYGLAREVESVKHAVVIVGLEAIKNLVLAASVLDMFKGKQIDSEYQEAFWRHSLAVGSCSRLLARQVRSRGMIDPDAAFSAGLLHDIGKMIIAAFLPEEFKRFQEARREDGESPDYAIEDRVFGYNHTHVGQLLAEQWKLPARLQLASAFHHNLEAVGDSDPIAYLVHLGNYLAKNTFLEDQEKGKQGLLDEQVVDYLQITPEQLQEYSEQAQEEYLKAETFMQMAGLH